MATSVVDAKREYYQSLGIEGQAVAELESKYYQGAASGAVPAAPLATETIAGLVQQAEFQPAAAGANPTKAEYDALLAALIAAGIMAAS